MTYKKVGVGLKVKTEKKSDIQIRASRTKNEKSKKV